MPLRRYGWARDCDEATPRLPTLLASHERTMATKIHVGLDDSTDEYRNTSRGEYWKAWVLPLVLGSLVALAVSIPHSQQLPLLGQLIIMGSLVYQSSKTARDIRYRTPALNVMRAIFGSIFIVVAEVTTIQMAWSYYFSFKRPCCIVSLIAALIGAVGLILVEFLFTYATCALTDYMFHRFVWHAHWAKSHTSLLFRAVHRHYVQHYLAHHHHVHHAETRSNLAKLSPSPMGSARKHAIEGGSSVSVQDVNVLWCSNHGLTVGVEDDPRVTFSMKWGCRLHTALMCLAMPCGTAVIINAIQGSFIGMLRHCISIAFILYITFHHDKYHADVEQRNQWVDRRYKPSHTSCAQRAISIIGKALWLSEGMSRVTQEHIKHHHSPEHRDEYYGLVPYGSFFIYPVWQSW